jgi:hypothetical protein
MSNIKTVEVIKALPGLEIGDTLTRVNKQDNFELNVETITDTYSAKRVISISESLLNKQEFKATEWFSDRNTYSKEKINQMQSQIDYLKKELANDDALLSKYESRIAEKLEQFRNEYARVEKAIANGEYEGELLWSADESLTVHYNMIDLLEKIIA